FDQALPQPSIAGIDDFLQLGNDRIRGGVVYRKYANGLPLHPLGIETQHSLDGSAALGSAALDEKHISRGIRANCARPGREAVEQLDQCLGGDVLQRNDRNPIARLRAGRIVVYVASADRFAERYEAKP